METHSDNLFWGEYEHGVDDKGRLVIPQEFRPALTDEFVLTRGPDKAVFLFPKVVWGEIEHKLQSHVLHRHTGFLQRMLGGRTFVKLDPQSRLAIPKHLRDWANISQSQSAVLIGQGPKIEIWSKGTWDAYNAGFTYEAMYEAAEAVGLADTVGFMPVAAAVG
jgi:MraZ protein